MVLLQASISVVISSFVHFALSLADAMFANGVSQEVMGHIKKWIVGKTALELRKNTCTQGPSAHLSARVQGLYLLLLGHSSVSEFRHGNLKKNKCVHISAQQVLYSGTKCECTLIVTVFSI